MVTFYGYIYKMAQGLLGFLWDAGFAAPHVLGFAVMLSKFTNNGVTTGVASMPSVPE